MPSVRGGGSITPLGNNSYLLQVSIGKSSLTGKYERISKRVHGVSKSEAKAELRKFIADVEAGRKQRQSLRRFGEYADAWLESRKTQRAHGTWRKYRDHIRVLNVHFAHARLDQLTPLTIEAAYNAMLGGVSPSGKPLCSAYVHGIHVTLSLILKDAVRHGVIASNPCNDVEPPPIDIKEKKALDINAMKDLIERLDYREESQFAILMILKTGMRRGEVVALSCNDIDFDKHVIHVRHSADESGEVGKPKTRKSARDIPMSASVEQLILDRCAYLTERFAYTRARLGTEIPTLTNDSYLVCNTLGERPLPHAVTAWWSKHRDNYGLSGWTVHEFRHSYLTELAKRGANVKALQGLAGHASYSTTMDIYVHLDMAQKQEAASLADW